MRNSHLKLGHAGQSLLKVDQEIRLMQQLRPVVGKPFVHHRRQDSQFPPQPAAQTNELREFLIVHFIHRLLDAVLSAIHPAARFPICASRPPL
jgi:hypothetical protein